MIEAGAPSTGELYVCVACARHTGGSHGRTTGARAQHREGTKEGRVAQQKKVSRKEGK
jgi:hypothetical protein